MKVEKKVYLFKKGDVVKKVTGYEFVGEIQGVITNSKKDVRYVVEDFLGRTEYSGGTLHIFSENQLEKENNINDSIDRIIKKLKNLK